MARRAGVGLGTGAGALNPPLPLPGGDYGYTVAFEGAAADKTQFLSAGVNTNFFAYEGKLWEPS
ncbi:hypothetical protein BST81_17730 [Leptolyngbya sp. 'hensonii']|nr:hypothetical protein BST81_17730 [Leptolyngbya sp. 'hensonii']